MRENADHNNFEYEHFSRSGTLRSETIFGNWKPIENDEKCFLFHFGLDFSNSNLIMADVFWVLKVIMGRKAETYPLNQVKELLQMHENTLVNVFNSTIDRLEKKLIF